MTAFLPIPIVKVREPVQKTQLLLHIHRLALLFSSSPAVAWPWKVLNFYLLIIYRFFKTLFLLHPFELRLLIDYNIERFELLAIGINHGTILTIVHGR
tara:strand:+ start:1422 stop:1715 length:294 start_codon:yes stop_codon:yes gene_type:complete